LSNPQANATAVTEVFSAGAVSFCRAWMSRTRFTKVMGE
jgi:hypothetical protein